MTAGKSILMYWSWPVWATGFFAIALHRMRIGNWVYAATRDFIDIDSVCSDVYIHQAQTFEIEPHDR